MLMRFGRAGVACVLVGLVSAPLIAEEAMRPQWAVGQDKVSTENLRVTPPPAAPAELSVQDAVLLALHYNAGFRSTMQYLLSTQSAWWAAQQRWQFTAFGNLNHTTNGEAATASLAGASFEYFATTGAILSVNAELSRVDSEQEQTLSLSASQPLLAGSGKASDAYERLRAARNAYRSGLVEFFVARQALAENVIGAYFYVVQQQELKRIQDDSVQLAQQAVSDARTRLESKLIREIDLTRAQLRLATAQSDAVFAAQAEENAMDGLMRVLGLQVGGQPKLVTAVPYAPEPLDVEAAVARALEQRPELRLAQLGIENREAALRIARSQRRPSLDLFAGMTQIRDGINDRTWSMGVQFAAPVASRWLAAAVQQADWDLLVSLQDEQDLRQEITAEVRAEARAAEAAFRNVKIATESLEVARRSLYIAGRIVEEGLGENRDVIDAQSNLTQSEVSLASSRINYYLATVRLRRATGDDIARDLPTARAGAETAAPAASVPSQQTSAPGP